MAINSDPQKFNSHPALHTELKTISSKVKKILLVMLKPQKGSGPLYEAARHLILAGGKMLRPYLVVKSCETVCGRRENALIPAAAIELLHTFTLVHDDIIDRDDTRRGVPTVHTKWDVSAAILSGDLLFATVYKAMLEEADSKTLPPKGMNTVLNLLTQAAIKLCEGQMLDITFTKLEDITEENYIEMIGKKTSYLFKTAAEVGAVVGGGTNLQIQRLGEFANLSGFAFQIIDDILGLTAEEHKLGKPVGNDIREKKKTLPIIHALQHSTSTQKITILKATDRNASKTDVLKARDTIISLGSVSYSLSKAEGYIHRAVKQLDIFPQEPTKVSLLQFANLLVKRSF